MLGVTCVASVGLSFRPRVRGGRHRNIDPEGTGMGNREGDTSSAAGTGAGEFDIVGG